MGVHSATGSAKAKIAGVGAEAVHESVSNEVWSQTRVCICGKGETQRTTAGSRPVVAP